jgi:uncharacterized protein DUF6152
MVPRIYHVVIASACLLSTESAWAHHSISAVFDQTKRVPLTGTLTKLDWRNPHIQFFVEVKGDKGQAESWSIEGGSPNVFKGQKIGKTNFESAMGQSIILEANPAKDGSRYGLMVSMTFPDGTVFNRE